MNKNLFEQMDYGIKRIILGSIFAELLCVSMCLKPKYVDGEYVLVEVHGNVNEIADLCFTLEELYPGYLDCFKKDYEVPF